MAIATSSLKVLRRPLESTLHAAVAMMNEPPWGSAALEGHDQGVDAEARLEVIRHRPAADLARGQVLDGRQVEKALIGRLRGRLCAIPPSWGARVLYRTLHSTGGKPSYSHTPSS